MGYEGSILLSSGLYGPDTNAYFKRPARSIQAVFGQRREGDGSVYYAATLNRTLWGDARDEIEGQIAQAMGRTNGVSGFERRLANLPFFNAGTGSRAIDDLWCLRKADPALQDGIAFGHTPFRFYRGAQAVTRTIRDLDPLSYKILSGVDSVAEDRIEMQVDWNIVAVIAPHADVLLPKEKMTQDELWRRALALAPVEQRLTPYHCLITGVPPTVH